MGFIKEFKEFAMKGNVMDMAVGVIIGGAFGKIVTSLVNDVLMPLIGMITGNIDFTSLSFKIGEGEEAAVLAYGNFIQNTVDFIIVAFCNLVYDVQLQILLLQPEVVLQHLHELGNGLYILIA